MLIRRLFCTPNVAAMGGTAAFSPTSISGLTLWFDASDSGSITQSGGAVSQWNDKSGNANHATQATGSKQPTILTADQNGRDTLNFTAAGAQFMDLTSTVNVDSAYTLCCVMKHPTAGSTSTVFGNKSAVMYYGFWLSDAVIYSRNTTGYVGSTSQTSTAYNQISIDKTGSSGNIYFNGSSITSGNTADARTAGVNAINNVNTTTGNAIFAELILYNSVLGTTDRQNVESYLKTKWGTP